MSEMTLRLPMNYVEVERDEMEYIDGGWGLDIMPDGVFGALIDVAIGGIAGAGVSSIKRFILKEGAQAAERIFTKTIKSKLIAWGAGKLAPLVGGAVSFALTYADIGNAAARWIDARDVYPNDGWISI
jgi:hypothetical protein